MKGIRKEKIIELLKRLGKQIHSLFAIVGVLVTLNWLHSNYIYGIHRNDNIEDVIVINTNSQDTVMVYKKIAIGNVKYDTKKDGLYVEDKGVRNYHKIAMEWEVHFIDYDKSGKRNFTNIYQ